MIQAHRKMALFNVNRFDRNRFSTFVSAFVVCAGLMGVGGEVLGGHEGDEHSASFTLSGGAVDVSIVYGATTTAATYTLGTGAIGAITSGFASNTFILTTDITADDPALTLGGAFVNTGDSGEFRINSGGVAGRIDFAETSLGGSIGLQNIDIITIAGGTVNGNIDASTATAATTFNLEDGTITGDVFGGGGDDTFIIGSEITVSGRINGGGGVNTLSLAEGFTADTVDFTSGILTLTFSDGSIRLTLVNIDTSDIADLVGQTALTFTGTTGADIFAITTDLTGSPAMPLESVIDGLEGQDELQLNAGAVVAGVSFSDQAPMGGAVHLRSVDIITIDGGTVNGNITGPATAAIFTLTSGTVNGGITGGGAGDIFNLTRGTITGAVSGGNGNDIFSIMGDTRSALTLNVIDGQGGTDEFQLNSGGVARRIDFTDDPLGRSLGLQNIDIITINGGTADTISAADAVEGVRFNLRSGTITSSVFGSPEDDTFIIGAGISIDDNLNGFGGTDTLRLATGFTPTSANLFGGVLTLGLTGGGSIELTLVNIETDNIDVGSLILTMLATPTPVLLTFPAATSEADIFAISNNITGSSTERLLLIAINGLDGTDELQLNAGAVVASVSFSAAPPAMGAVHLQSIETITINGGRVTGTIDASPAPAGVTFNLIAGMAGSGDIIGSGQNDIFIISGDITGNRPLAINGLIQGNLGQDEVRLIPGGVVGSLDLFDFGAGELSVRGVEIITIDGGTVNRDIDFSDALASVTFNLVSGAITGDVYGSINHGDIFNLGSGITINGFLDGGVGNDDVLRYAGAPSGTAFAARGGLAIDPDITDGAGSVSNIERQAADATITSLGTSLGVRGIEVLELSPALNLYGALSDALMQFGQQTAQGFALADLNLATGRATQLMSKDSPFTKGRVWAHKITHSGNGKGSIGLNLTGLTARAESDYNYEMSLTQHGFDAPLMTTRLGAFNLRAVSHTMTGVIETNVARAQVSGYGAGVALLWQKHNFSAHLTSLAGAYEVEAHTSKLNPQAVVSEVSEGSFSAINAVVSAGLADKRELTYGLSLRTSADVSWQTLSLDDFSETGNEGIAVDFDKATRFTARVGAGLESAHWFSDVAFVHETSSGGTLSSGLSQDYRQDDGTAIEMKLGGKIADLATGLTLKAYAGLRASLDRSDAIESSGHLALDWRF